MAQEKKYEPETAQINPIVFWGSVFCCLVFYVPMVIFQQDAQTIINVAMHSITYSLDWLWEGVALSGLIFLMWLAFGRYGNVKLGGPDDKPEFTTFTWISMFVCGGIGAGLVYWTMVEPIFYLKSPPFWAEPLSAQAAQWALSYGIFHWGFLAWGTFAIPAVAFSYMYYVRKKPYLYPSYACRGVLGERVDGWLGKVIDLVVIVGLVGGVGTSLGFTVPLLSVIIADMFGIADTMAVKAGVAVVWALIFGYSAYKGLYSGIAKLSTFTAYACFALLAFVLVVGPTTFLLSFYFDNLGMLFQNFFRMSLYTDPITKSGFPQDWTVFYWAWWYAWAIYIGLFATRISRGRTIKQLILAMVVVGTFGSSLFYLAFGGYASYLLLSVGIPLDVILKESGGPAMILVILKNLPLQWLFMPFFVIVMLIFQATSIDSNAYTMAMIGCKEIREGQEPPKWSRIFWAVMLLFVTLALLLVGGMEVVKLSSVLTSVPILFIVIILAISTVKWLREDFGVDQPLFTTKYDDVNSTNLTLPDPISNQNTDKGV